MSAFTRKLYFNVERALKFFSVFVRKKRALIGVGIILFFIVMAFAASSLTPYNPTDDVNLAGQLARPAWLKNFPGYSYLNENMNPVIDTGLNKPDSIRQWGITYSAAADVLAGYSATIGNPEGSGPGSMVFTFRREATGTTYGDVKVSVTKEFVFDSTGPPDKFSGDIALLVEGTSTKSTAGRALLDVPLKVDVFIRTGSSTYYLWPQPGSSENPRAINDKGEITEPTATWVTSKTSPESPISTLDSKYNSLKIKMYNATGLTLDPARTVFNQTRGLPASYEFGVMLTFEDSLQPDSTVETTVYVDELNFQTFGNAWGLLGTDQMGRDIFSQLVYGSRLSLYIGLLSTVIGVGLGLTIGLAAGYLGKVADELMMRFSDMLLIIPGLPLLIVLVSVLGPGLTNMVMILGFLGWMGFARLVRSQVLSLRERPFVEAAKAIGAGKIHVMVRHILPNVMSLVWITLATSVPGNIMSEAALSWLGFFDPNVMSWGRMLHDVQNTSGAIANWWWVLPPGLSIALIAVAFILVGFALDEVLNPKLRRRA